MYLLAAANSCHPRSPPPPSSMAEGAVCGNQSRMQNSSKLLKRCLDVTSIHVSSLITRPKHYNRRTLPPKKNFRPCDNCTQKWTECPFTQSCDTTTLKVGRNVTKQHYDVTLPPRFHPSSFALSPRTRSSFLFCYYTVKKLSCKM